MPRQSIIRIKAEIAIPYDRKMFGSASMAEKNCDQIKEAIEGALINARLVKWEPAHTSSDAESA